MIKIDYSKALSFLPDGLGAIPQEIYAAAELLHRGEGVGAEYTGWLNLPVAYDREEYRRILAAAKRIRAQSEVLVVVGIGGSYLGALAALDFCSNNFYNLMPDNLRPGPQVLFAGCNLSGSYHRDLMDLLQTRDFSINVISKSGTTMEPAIAFRMLKELLEKKYGRKGVRERIYATTDAQKGALKQVADQEGYETFAVPDNVGGRFSVLTAVGLLPIAAVGIDTDALLQGAAEAIRYCEGPIEHNPAYQYAALRNALYRKGCLIEVLASYEPRMRSLAEWWKQLYGESEGKNGKGIFPASVSLTTDLHSMGQYLQDGPRHLFETVLHIQHPGQGPGINAIPGDPDGLNYLNGRSMNYVNRKAAEGTAIAHHEGGVPLIQITVPDATPFALGQLFYFFEKACAVSAYMLGVNPFDQPGVEAYKRNMFALLREG